MLGAWTQPSIIHQAILVSHGHALATMPLKQHHVFIVGASECVCLNLCILYIICANSQQEEGEIFLIPRSYNHGSNIYIY